MKKRSRLGTARTERGAAAVEFALIMPILFLILFAIIQYGLYFWAYQGGSDAARSAARLGAVGNPVACDDFEDAVKQDIAGVGDETTAEVSRSYEDAGGASIAAANVDIGDYVVVDVTFESTDLRIPFLPFVNDGEVNASSRARVDYLNNGKPEAC